MGKAHGDQNIFHVLIGGSYHLPRSRARTRGREGAGLRNGKEKNRSARRGFLLAALSAAALLAAVLIAVLPPRGVPVGAGAERVPAGAPLSERITNYEEVIAAIRHGLRYHAETVTVRFSYGKDILSEVTAVVGDWVEEALAETGDPEEGDYLRYQYGGYTIRCGCDRGWGRYRYTVEIRPDYYLYLVQEEELSAKLEEIRAGFGFDEDTSDLEKVRTIYAYVCSHVKYDRVHRDHPRFHLRSTAYAALVRQTATCQGYCAALYRMLMEEGIPARIVTGTGLGEGREEFHAWNLAELDGAWYALDATWDAGKETWAYFLRGRGIGEDHIPGKAFLTPDFVSQYTLSPEDCPAAEKKDTKTVVSG